MALAATRLEVHNAIVDAVGDADGIGKFYGRVRRPKEDQEKQIQDLFNDDNGIINVVFVRYVSKALESTSFDDLIAVSYVFELEVRYAWNERDDADSPSEVAFNALLDAIDAVFITDKNIGFDDVGVSTKGLEIQRAIERDPQPFYGKLCHTAYARVVATVAEC